jgi:DNA repair protein RecO (recombination protein O)
MLSKTRAIVLHHVKFGESSIIATLYTEKHGRLACMASGVRSTRTRMPMTFFQPLTLLDVELYYKPNRDIHRLREANCSFHYVSIPFVIGKSTMAIFLADVLLHTLQEQEGNSVLFDFLYHAFQLLDTQDVNYSNFHLRFLLHFTRYLGFYPGEISTADDLVRAAELHVFLNLRQKERSALVEMLKTSMSQADAIKLTRTGRAAILDRILEFYGQHLEGIGRIKSMQILKEIFTE